MIKKLRNRFIIICAISLFSVITLIFLFINTINITSTNKNLDKLANEIFISGGTLHKPSKEPMGPNKDPNHPPTNKPDSGYINPETPFSTRYFTVTYNSNNEIIKVNTESIYSVNNELAEQYANEVNDEKGWIDNFRYNTFNTSKGKTIIFVDGSINQTGINQTMLISFIVLYTSALIILILIMLLSKKVTAPTVEAYEKQKQFITDANHELKTPLTLILANLDIAETELGENEWLKDIRYEGHKMIELVNKLVELSRMDEENYKVEIIKLQFSEILKDIISEFKYILNIKEIQLITNIDDNIYINANEILITKLIYILMDNATKYCDHNGIISVTLTNPKHPILSIQNTYQAVNSIKLDKLFDRFYRGDKARTHNGGYGLGLSIAKNIVDYHKATINVSKVESDNIEFSVYFKN